jgi:ammonia channel protein AmtB
LLRTGGTVVHMSSGYAALVAALYLGPAMRDGLQTQLLLLLLLLPGGTVVHMSSGYAALVAALYLGPAMKGSQHDDMFEVKEPANVPYVVLGTALLFFGWFGVSGPSSL